VTKDKKSGRSARLREKVDRPLIADAAVPAARTDEFRTWLRGVVEGTGKSLHALEVEAGISGNGLGKFLRSERGSRHGLTPLLIRRIAPIISVSEEELFTRAGHLSYEPGHPPVRGGDPGRPGARSAGQGAARRAARTPSHRQGSPAVTKRTTGPFAA